MLVANDFFPFMLLSDFVIKIVIRASMSVLVPLLTVLTGTPE